MKKQVKLYHPESSDLAFLYGTILTDGKDEYSEKPTANVCVFADRQVIVKIFTGKCICDANRKLDTYFGLGF